MTKAAVHRQHAKTWEKASNEFRAQLSQRERHVSILESSFEMENFLHVCPPLAFLSCWQWVLHRLHDGPPFLRLGIRSHLAPILFQITAVVFQVSEEKVVLEEDGIVFDIAF